MSRKVEKPSQLMELFLHVAELLGVENDRDVAALADVGPENVGNWRAGAVREFKPQKLEAVKKSLGTHVAMLRAQATASHADGLHPLEIEEGASPADLHRQFRDRVSFDYLGHRFLYFEAQGALAWESLIRAGYGQSAWLDGAAEAARRWTDPRRDGGGRSRGALAHALGLDRRATPRGLDVVALGCGDGAKEGLVLERLLAFEAETGRRLAWLAYAPVDVSIPLLLQAARVARDLLAAGAAPGRAVLPFCADFEEGRLGFVRRLPTQARAAEEGLRLVVLLGNVFGNLRDEEEFVRQKLWTLTRPGDLVWLEVGLRMDPLDLDPLSRMTRADHAETAAEASRRLLLEGPYRRWEAAQGRRPCDLDMRVWMREDDESARIPGSINFCHDLVVRDERRVVTMLFSRRYEQQGLCAWLEARGFAVEGTHRVADTQQRVRILHLLLRRT
jgi:hypothetical protein